MIYSHLKYFPRCRSLVLQFTFCREMCSLICVMNAASSLTTIPLRAACNSAAQCIFYSGYNLSKPKSSKIQTLTVESL